MIEFVLFRVTAGGHPEKHQATRRCALVAVVVGALLMGAGSAHSAPFEYRIRGLFSGVGPLVFVPGPVVGGFEQAEYDDVPFEIAFRADSEQVFQTGTIAGIGRAWVLEGMSGRIRVDGLGTIISTDVQIYTWPGRATIGFAWKGDFFPLNSPTRAEREYRFVAGAFARDWEYGGLQTLVEPIDVSSATPSSMAFPFPGVDRIMVESFSQLRYSVWSVPEPSTTLLLGLGLAGLARRAASARKRKLPEASLQIKESSESAQQKP